MGRKGIFNWLVYISIIISGLVLVLMIVIYKYNLNNNGDLQKNKKQVYYKNTNVTSVFHKFPSLAKVSDEEKLQILQRLNIYWNEEKYDSNRAQNAKYGDHDLGKINDLVELPIQELQRIVDFQKSELRIKGREEGRKESRKGIYQLCTKTFRYYECNIDPRISLEFEGFNEFKEGSEPDINLDDSDVVRRLIDLYPNTKNRLANGNLIKIGVEGSKGKEENYGALFYKEKKILNLSKNLSSFEELNSQQFLNYFSFLFNRDDFSPFMMASTPTYDSRLLTFLPLGWEKEKITNKEKLQILGWNDEFLKIV